MSVKFSREAFLLRLEDLFERQLNTLQENKPLSDLPEWDSLMLLSYITVVKEVYGVIIPVTNIAQAKTVGTLIDLVEQRISLNNDY